MLNALKSLLGGDREPDRAAPALTPEIAATALMVEVALADGAYERIERERILHALEDAFELDAEAARAVLDQAEPMAREAVDHHRFTRVVKDGLNEAKRVRLMQDLWAVVLADGDRDDREDALMRRLAPLLAVSDRDSADARRRVLEGRD